jgi:hypothetical protein
VEQQLLAAQDEMLQAPSASLPRAAAQRPPELCAQEQQTPAALNETHQAPSASLLQAPAQRLPEFCGQEQQTPAALNETHLAPSASRLRTLAKQPLEPHALNPRRQTHQDPLPASVPAAVPA